MKYGGWRQRREGESIHADIYHVALGKGGNLKDVNELVSSSLDKVWQVRVHMYFTSRHPITFDKCTAWKKCEGKVDYSGRKGKRSEAVLHRHTCTEVPHEKTLLKKCKARAGTSGERALSSSWARIGGYWHGKNTSKLEESRLRGWTWPIYIFSTGQGVD